MVAHLGHRLTMPELAATSAAPAGHGHNVTVVRQDATAMSFPDAKSDRAVSFTMLHQR